MTTFTTPLNLIKPVVGSDKDIWGGYWNTNADTLNGIFTPTGTGLAVGLHIGTMTLPDTTTVPGTFKLDGTGLFDALLDNATWRDKTDPTKAFQVKADNLPTATTRHVQVPSADGVLATESYVQAQVRQYVPTGTVLSGYFGTTAPAGFVFADGRLIGDATSGANNRANADCQALFTLLWGFNDDTRFPVLPQGSGTTPSRGATAAADWLAHKRITLPNHAGRTMAGRDDLSGTSQNVLSPAIGGTSVIRGGAGGEALHTLSVAEMPSHTHTTYGSTLYGNVGNAFGTTSSGGLYIGFGGIDPANTGSNGAHNTVQPTIVVDVIVAL